MINNISIKALKSIADINISCSKLNLFVGTNSSGKSTVLQAILLISQNLEYMYGLNGPLVSLGEFREIKNFNIGDKEIVVTLQLESSDIKLSINEDSNLLSSSLDLDIIINSLSYRKQKLHYLSCHRIGCQDFYHKNMYSIDPFD